MRRAFRYIAEGNACDERSGPRPMELSQPALDTKSCAKGLKGKPVRIRENE